MNQKGSEVRSRSKRRASLAGVVSRLIPPLSLTTLVVAFAPAGVFVSACATHEPTILSQEESEQLISQWQAEHERQTAEATRRREERRQAKAQGTLTPEEQRSIEMAEMLEKALTPIDTRFMTKGETTESEVIERYGKPWAITDLGFGRRKLSYVRPPATHPFIFGLSSNPRTGREYWIVIQDGLVVDFGERPTFY